MQIYQLKITLANAETAFNRVFWMEETSTFSDLLEVIFVLFDWRGFSEQKFTFELDQNETKLMVIAEEVDEYNGCYEGEFLVASVIKLNKIFGSQTNKINFVYDLEDCFVFDIVLEEMFEKKAVYNYPLCISGALSAPPERNGSNEIYVDLIKFYANKAKYKRELQIFETWHQGKFDVNYFDIKSINKVLKSIL